MVSQPAHTAFTVGRPSRPPALTAGSGDKGGNGEGSVTSGCLLRLPRAPQHMAVHGVLQTVGAWRCDPVGHVYQLAGTWREISEPGSAKRGDFSWAQVPAGTAVLWGSRMRADTWLHVLLPTHRSCSAVRDWVGENSRPLPSRHQMVASSSVRPTETCHTFPPPPKQHSGPWVTSSLEQTTKTNPILFREAQSRCISDSKKQTDFYFEDITTEDSREHLAYFTSPLLSKKDRRHLRAY